MMPSTENIDIKVVWRGKSEKATLRQTTTISAESNLVPTRIGLDDVERAVVKAVVSVDLFTPPPPSSNDVVKNSCFQLS